LKADTAATVRIGPAVSITDGYTLTASLAISTADYAYISDAGGTETDISANTWAAVTSVTGWYDLTLTAGQLGVEGPLLVMIYDVSLCLPIWAEFHVVNANVYDSLFAAAATDYLQVDSTTQGGATSSAQTTAQADLDILTGTDGAALATSQPNYAPAVAGDSMALTAAAVDAIWDEVLTGGTHNVTDSAGKRIRDLQEFGTYEGGYVFIDTVNGAAGTTDYENGTILNPISTIADAVTIATSLNLSRFAIAPGSSITLASSQVSKIFNGRGWTLALGGQDVSSTEFIGAQVVSGTGTTPTGECHFVECELGTITIGQAHFIDSALTGTMTITAAATYTLDNCYSKGALAIIDFGAAVGSTEVNMPRWSGDFEVQNMGQVGTDVLRLHGDGELTINANCVGGTVHLYGDFEVTDNSGGAVTISYDDNTVNIQNIITDTNELQTDWANGGRLDLLVDQIISDIAWVKTDTGTTIPGIIDDLAVKKNTAFPNYEFLMVLSSDGKTPATGLTITGQRSIDGGAFAAVTGPIAEVGNGIYQFDAAAADTNGDFITWRFSAATADDAFVPFKTVQ